MNGFRLTKEDSADIGFATTCLTFSAITFEEFKGWLDEVIAASDEYPVYVFDILDLEKKFEYTLRVRQILGFIPSLDLSRDAYRAIDGIAYRRFREHRSDFSKKQTALKALTGNPGIEKQFRALFPFIDW